MRPPNTFAILWRREPHLSQPVVDTLQISDALRKTGMAREQAEGLARALGDELGAHVVAQGDLQTGFQELRGEIQSVDHTVKLVRSDLGGSIHQVKTELHGKIDRVNTDLGGRIAALDSKLTFMIASIGLFVAAVTLASSMGVFQPAPPSAQGPTGTTRAPAVVPPTVTPSPPPMPGAFDGNPLAEG